MAIEEFFASRMHRVGDLITVTYPREGGSIVFRENRAFQSVVWHTSTITPPSSEVGEEAERYHRLVLHAFALAEKGFVACAANTP